MGITTRTDDAGFTQQNDAVERQGKAMRAGQLQPRRRAPRDRLIVFHANTLQFNDIAVAEQECVTAMSIHFRLGVPHEHDTGLSATKLSVMPGNVGQDGYVIAVVARMSDANDRFRKRQESADRIDPPMHGIKAELTRLVCHDLTR